MLYESDDDRKREHVFALEIEQRFTCKLHKLPYEWEFDYLISRNELLTSIGEVKHRKHSKDKYPTVIFSEHKANKGFRFCNRTLVWSVSASKFVPPKFIFFVQFVDGRMFCDLKEGEFNEFERVKLSAKNHEEDPTDTEWVRYIPIELFKEF